MERTERNKPKERSVRKRIALAVIGLSWVGILLVWWSRRPPNLELEAERAHRAMLSADGDTLMRYAFEEEVAANNLTPEKLERLYKEIILPKLRTIRWAERVPSESNVHAGYAHYIVVNRFGQRRGMGTTAYNVDGSPRVSVLEQVFGAWIQEHYNERLIPVSNNLDKARAVLAGLEKDTERLKAIGITSLGGVEFIKGKINLLPLDQLRPRYERWIRQLEKQAAKAASTG